MKPRKQQRMQRVEQAIATIPIRGDVRVKAFEHFRKTGELPEHQQLAKAVTEQALNGGTPPPERGDAAVNMAVRLLDHMDAIKRRGLTNQPPYPIREMLFREAVHGTGFVRKAARLALRVEVCAGADVADRQFLEDETMPRYGCAGMHLLGFPEFLAQPPFVEQFERLMARFAELRQRINKNDDEWFERLGAATAAFYQTGELPQDALLREVLLANAELHGLMRHAIGEDVTTLMAEFATMASSSGDERAASIARMQRMAAEGRS